MALTAEALREKIIDKLGASHAEVVDTSGGCGGKFEAVIVSKAFEGLSTLNRHRFEPCFFFSSFFFFR